MSDRLCRWLAWHLPDCIVVWCAIRVLSFATSGSYSTTVVPELTAMEAIRRFEAEHAD